MPTSLDPINLNTGRINGTPTQAEGLNNGGIYDVTVTATDPDGLSIDDTFRLTIAVSNRQPTLVSPIGNQSGAEDAPFSLNVSGNFTDPER